MLYNPSLLSPEELRRSFIVRKPELDALLTRVEGVGSSLQHMLVIGTRGMGKTTLFYRLACAIEDDPSLSSRWLPICFDEEQYNVGNLTDLWLNCLEIIAESTRDDKLYRQIDRLQDEHKSTNEWLEQAIFKLLKDLSNRLDQKFLLLVDNVDIVLERLSEGIGVHRLRSLLQHEGWLMLIGAASNPIEMTYDYGKPFYDFFHTIELDPLGRDEAIQLISGLARLRDKESSVTRFIETRGGLFDSMHMLMGGNVRTVSIFGDILVEEPDADFERLLNLLLDRHTIMFKDRIEALSPLGQRVFDALARSWDPATADQIAADIRVERGPASAQLHRLTQRGFVQKVALPERAIGFQVAERFFNVWCLMRGRRRNRQKLGALVRFIELFYAAEAPVTDFDRLLNRLKRFGLVDDAVIARIDVCVERLNGKRNLLPEPAARGGGLNRLMRDAKAWLLAACKLGLMADFEEQKKILRGLGETSVLPQLAQSYVLVQQDRLEEALEVLEQGTSQILALERFLILVKLKENRKAASILLGFDDMKDVTVAGLAGYMVELANADGDGMASQGMMVLEDVLRREPENEETRFAACELELKLNHVGQALTHLKLALYAKSKQDESVKSRRILTKVLAVAARGDENSALAFLKETGLSERWQPVTHALAHLGGEDSDRLRRLAPEMRGLTEAVEARIHELRSAAAVPQSSSAKSR